MYLLTSLQVDSDVEYPLVLRVGSQFQSADLISRRAEQVFELRAAVLHHGVAASGGHYTVVCRDRFGQWRHFDDVKVGLITEAEALAHRDTAYILLYAQREGQ